ncbi:hypothetical protein EJ04DRAFT_452918 [Polyplosphaeria fusca]|uniref:Rhodopsin domain-containing protein n=1 Tax=Polyplosphaeria fusca TaxID=682080 RepID=A0A9P4QG41_9PLEO|nr:hypothetical protein EJ04DRAFT_452918 [Polyplosphaeria fusca]
MFYDAPSVSALYRSIIPLLVLDIVVVALRFSTRRKLNQKISIDDWLMIPALVGVIGMASIYFNGLGKKALGYQWMITPPSGTDVTSPDFQSEVSSLIIFAATNGFVKLSVLAMYKRIFVIAPSWRNARNIFFAVTMTIIGMWAVAFTFTYMFMCGVDYDIMWNAETQVVLQKCVNTFMVAYSHSISDFITDALVILIPLPFIWQLHLPLGRKLGVCFVFLLGVLSTAASGVRLAFQIWGSHQMTGDEELIITTEIFWINIEIVIGVIAACLPTLPGLFKTLSVASMVRSVQAMFSVDSVGSTGSLTGHKNSKDLKGLEKGSPHDDWKSGEVEITTQCTQGTTAV